MTKLIKKKKRLTLKERIQKYSEPVGDYGGRIWTFEALDTLTPKQLEYIFSKSKNQITIHHRHFFELWKRVQKLSK